MIIVPAGGGIAVGGGTVAVAEVGIAVGGGTVAIAEVGTAAVATVAVGKNTRP